MRIGLPTRDKYVECVDFDIHGLVMVRLIAPSAANVRAVAQQIGPPSRTALSHPDITVRYVHSIPTRQLHYIDLSRTALTESGFTMFPEGKTNGKLTIPFEQVGADCEIVCEHKVGWIPLLIPIVNLTALGKRGCVPLHASGFIHDNVGVLVTGWIKSGKTEALLAFSQEGANYVAGEWALLTAKADTMYGLPGTFRIWDWHRRSLRKHRKIGSHHKLSRLIRTMDALQSLVPQRLLHLGPMKLLHQAMPVVRRQLNFRVEPTDLFGSKCLYKGRLDKIFVGMVHPDKCIEITPADSKVVAAQLATAMEFELTPLMSHYRAFQFACPGCKNTFLDNIHDLLRESLRTALEGKETYMLYHPYPVDFDDLYKSMHDHLLHFPPCASMKSLEMLPAGVMSPSV